MNNNVQNENEPNEIDPEPEKVHSIAESLLCISFKPSSSSDVFR